MRIRKQFYNPYRVVGYSKLDMLWIKNKATNKLRYSILFTRPFYYWDNSEFITGLNEIFLLQIYRSKLPKNAKIIDCGAYIGMSVIYFKQNNPDCQILAFEPDTINFEVLKKNISPYYNNVELRNEAVWVQDTILKFSNKGTTASSLLDDNHSSDYSSVKAIRLKDFITGKIDFLKFDIEGAEFEVLKDLGNALNWVDQLFVEYHGNFKQNHELNEILSILSNFGFYYYIKEANINYKTPFYRDIKAEYFDVQLNIFCFKKLE